MAEKPPTGPADHAHEFARKWADKLEEHCTIRMKEIFSMPHVHARANCL